MTDKMREAFEAWAGHALGSHLDTRVPDHDVYIYDAVEAAWQAWKAAQRQGGEAVDAITKANANYAKGVDVHEIFKELKDVERDNSCHT